jgi:amino acid permease
MSTVAVIMLAYSFTINLFPIYAGLKEKTNSYYKKSIIQSLFLVVFIYTFMPIVCILLFGKSIDADANILAQINEET